MPWDGRRNGLSPPFGRETPNGLTKGDAMYRRADQQARNGLAILVVAFLTMLVQAGGTHAQTSGREPGCNLPARDLIDAQRADTNAPANLDPALAALADVAGKKGAAAGGLWLSGNIAGGFTYLHWIAGNQPAGLLKLDSERQVSFNLRVLAKAAGITSESPAGQRARIASFLRSDEGLKLLAEVIDGTYRLLLHIGPTALTRGGSISDFGVRNFDNRFDSRINPLRPDGRKVDIECPPDGFDSLIVIDPEVCWFNVRNRQLVPTAQMTFHELAEAHARLVLDLDYLPQGDRAGAHDAALDREVRLKQQRRGQFVVEPIGLNLRLTSRADWLRLFAKLDLGPVRGRDRTELRMRSFVDSFLQGQ